MDVNSGQIGPMDELMKGFEVSAGRGVKIPSTKTWVVPIPTKYKFIMEDWGHKKRTRYAELVGSLGEEEAYHIVEHHGGEV